MGTITSDQGAVADGRLEEHRRGATLIGLSPLIWLANVFVRMTFNDDGRERESDARASRTQAARRA